MKELIEKTITKIEIGVLKYVKSLAKHSFR